MNNGRLLGLTAWRESYLDTLLERGVYASLDTFSDPRGRGGSSESVDLRSHRTGRCQRGLWQRGN